MVYYCFLSNSRGGWKARVGSTNTFDRVCFSETSRRVVETVASREKSTMPEDNAEDEEVRDPKGRVIIIAGPTGVGKTRLALALSKRLGGEIISVDSVQGIPHHLMDIVNPSEGCREAKAFADTEPCGNVRHNLHHTVEIFSCKHLLIDSLDLNLLIMCSTYSECVLWLVGNKDFWSEYNQVFVGIYRSRIILHARVLSLQSKSCGEWFIPFFLMTYLFGV